MKAINLAVFLWISLCMGALSPALAAADLYTGEAVTDSDARVEDRELLRAFDEVLVRLTGRIGESLHATLGIDASQVRSLVQSQQRIQVNGYDDNGEAIEQLRLKVVFDANRVNELLARNRIAQWGRERPAILLWIALDDDQGLRLAGSDPIALNWHILEQGRRLGLDIVRPLGDALDLAEVRVSDVRGGFLDAVQPGLRRYQAGIPAMLDLRTRPDGWSSRWFWRLDGRDRSLNHTASNQYELVERGLEAILAGLTERYATQQNESGSGALRVIVGPIVDSVQYAEVLRYLQELSMVESLSVVSARQRDIEFELIISGGGFEDVIGLGDLLSVDQRYPDGRLYLQLNQ